MIKRSSIGVSLSLVIGSLDEAVQHHPSWRIFSLPRHQLVTPIVQLYPRYESGLPSFSYISWRGNKANAYPLSTKNSRCEVQTLGFLFFRMEQAVFEVGTGPVPQ